MSRLCRCEFIRLAGSGAVAAALAACGVKAAPGTPDLTPGAGSKASATPTSTARPTETPRPTETTEPTSIPVPSIKEAHFGEDGYTEEQIVLIEKKKEQIEVDGELVDSELTLQENRLKRLWHEYWGLAEDNPFQHEPIDLHFSYVFGYDADGKPAEVTAVLESGAYSGVVFSVPRIQEKQADVSWSTRPMNDAEIEILILNKGPDFGFLIPRGCGPLMMSKVMDENIMQSGGYPSTSRPK